MERKRNAQMQSLRSPYDSLSVKSTPKASGKAQSPANVQQFPARKATIIKRECKELPQGIPRLPLGSIGMKK